MQTIDDTTISLRQHFGFEAFREGQREVIDAVFAGKDTLAVMPTGSGKSLGYQLPALMMEGATLVVSPLIALMKDQVDALQARGLPATFINSAISDSEQRSRIEAVRKGEYKLIYVAPERFRSPRFNAALRSINISLFALMKHIASPPGDMTFVLTIYVARMSSSHLARYAHLRLRPLLLRTFAPISFSNLA
jgi:ATP-dependent DNA helicase RecQ